MFRVFTHIIRRFGYTALAKPFPLVIIPLLVVLHYGSVHGQVLSVYDIQTQDYPYVEAKYLYMDEAGRQVHQMDPDRFRIDENQQAAELIRLSDPTRGEPRKLSVVLAFDVSSSMDEQRLHMAREAALQFVDLLPLELSECAISSFDHQNYLNSDFTHSQERLEEAIHSLEARGGTNYNSGFISPFSGALRVAEEGAFKRIVIFLTDGLGEGSKKQIVQKANEEDITVYPITIGLETPGILKDIAAFTGGRYYGEVNDVEQARAIYNEILLTAQSVKPGTIRWKSPNGCSDIIRANFQYAGGAFRTRYRLTPDQRVQLRVDPLFLRFDTLQPGSRQVVQLQAEHTDFTLHALELNKPGTFSLQHEGDLPVRLPEDSVLRLEVGHHTGRDAGGYAVLTIDNEPCPDYHVYLKSDAYRAGAGLQVVYPNGGETLSAGLPDTLRWKGLAPRDRVVLYHSADGGEQWTKIDEAEGLEYVWEAPADIGRNHLIRAEQVGDAGGAVGFDPLLAPSGQEYKAHAARFVDRGRYIVTLEDDHVPKLWEGSTGRFIRSLPGHEDWVYDVASDKDGRRIVTASDDGSARIIQLPEGNTVKELRINNWGINKALFTRDGRRVITAGDDGAVRVWDAASGDHLYGILAHSGWVLDIDISPDGRYLASGGDDKQIRIWDLHTGRHVRTLEAHHNWVHDVAYHPNGSSLLSASKDSTFRLWDATTGRLIHTNRLHQGQVYSANYSPSGDKILTSSKDGSVRLWDGEGKQQLASLEADPGEWFHKAYFGEDASHVITASSQRKVKVWVVHQPEPFQHDVSDQAFQIVSPAPRFEPLHLGNHYVGHPRDTLLKGFFVNPSEHPLKVKQVQLGGEDKNDFTLVSGFQEFIMPPQSRKDLEMIFRAGSVGKKQAEVIAITPTDSVSVPVRGRGLLQRYDIPHDHLNLGRLTPGEKRDSTIVMVRNRGNTALHIGDMTLEGAGRESFVLRQEGEEVVYPNGKKRIRVGFTPHETGRSNARLTFRVNQTRHSIDLMGEGTGPSHVVLTGRVLSRGDEKPLSADVEYFDLKTNRNLGESETPNSEYYRLKMHPGRKYRVVAEAQGYIPGNISVDLRASGPVDTIRRNIYLAPIRAGSEVTLNNIFFEYGRARLTETSRGELGQISRFLKANDTLHVEIAGHTDSIGTRESNLQLSRDRAEAVRAFLVEAGVEPARIKAKGYGERKPVADNSSEEGRQKNRRVVFTIIRSSDRGTGQ